MENNQGDLNPHEGDFLGEQEGEHGVYEQEGEYEEDHGEYEGEHGVYEQEGEYEEDHGEYEGQDDDGAAHEQIPPGADQDLNPAASQPIHDDFDGDDQELLLGDDEYQGKSRILQFEVVSEEGVPTHVMKIEVIDTLQKKPFLGGYRHKETGVEYHHASMQTVFIPKPKKKLSRDGKRIRKFHRETQTVKTKTRSQQTYREQGTQMDKNGLSIDHKRDRVYIPTGKYFSSDDFLKLRTRKTIKIQAFVRGWRARRQAARLKEDKRKKQQNQEEEQFQQQQKEIEKKRRDIKRRMHPQKKKDFEVLYSELEQWRLHETQRIKEESETDSERQLALIDLLRKETKLLQTIDRLKQAAHKENHAKRINKKLEFLAKPKKIKNWNGEHTLIETPFTVRAQELMDLYYGLNTPHLSVDERLDVLLHVKWTVKEFDCILTRDIVELIDREADLLNRGRKDRALIGLRKRLLNLFLQFIETPEFNPLASKLKSKTSFANTQPMNN